MSCTKKLNMHRPFVLSDRIDPSTMVPTYPRGICFAFHRAGGAGRIIWILYLPIRKN
jgi:hypothetical protein